jgi:hypothetical protein
MVAQLILNLSRLWTNYLKLDALAVELDVLEPEVAADRGAALDAHRGEGIVGVSEEKARLADTCGWGVESDNAGRRILAVHSLATRTSVPNQDQFDHHIVTPLAHQ